MGSRRSIVKAHQHHEFVDALAHTYLVNDSETKEAVSNGHNNSASVKAENDDSDEGKHDDGVNIEAGAPNGEPAPGTCLDKWLRVCSSKEEEEEEA